MGNDATSSVTDANGRFHFVSNAYVAGPALFPSVGSPNPMLTGMALARRMADHLVQAPPVTPDPGFTGTDTFTYTIAGSTQSATVTDRRTECARVA